MRPGASGGKRPVWRVLEFVDERLEQEDDQQMSQDPGLGGVFAKARRRGQANQTLQAFEGEFDIP